MYANFCSVVLTSSSGAPSTFDEVANDLAGLSDRLLALGTPAARPIPVAADSVAANDSTAHDSAALVAPAAAPSQLASIDTLAKYLQLGGRGGATVGLAQDRDRNKIDSLLALATEYHLLPEDLTLLWGAKPIQDPKTRKLTNIYELYAIRTNRSMKPRPLGVTSSLRLRLTSTTTASVALSLRSP